MPSNPHSSQSSPDDPGYEVVSDPGYEVVKPPPPRAAAPIPMAKPLPAKPLPAKPLAAETKVLATDTAETPVKPKKKSKVYVVEEEEEEEERPKRIERRLAEDDFNDLPGSKPRLSKADRRRVREERRREEAAERAAAAEEWTMPGILMGIGGALTLGSAVILGMSSAKAAVGVVLMLILSVVWVVISVPLIIVMLMVIGKVCGIEYGSAKHTFRSLGAIVILATGIYWAGGTLGCVGWIIAPVVAFIVTYALFVKFFELDASEARMSMAAVNFITGVGNYLFRVLLITALIVGSLPDKPSGTSDPNYQDADEQMMDEEMPPGGGFNNTKPVGDKGQPNNTKPPRFDPDSE